MSIPTARLRIIALLIILLIAAPWIDTTVSDLLHRLGEGGMDRFLAFVCSWPFIAVLFLTPLCWKGASRRNGYAAALIAVMLASLASFALKEWFQVARPFDTAGWTPLEPYRDYGFPSSHASAAFALLPLVTAYGSRLQHRLWLVFALFIALSRVMLGMHFPSDVIAGGLLGSALGSGIVASFEKRGRRRELVTRHREMIRQIVHMAFGVVLVLLVRVALVPAWVLLLIAAMGGLLSLLDTRFGVRPFGFVIDLWERPSDRASFPGRGIVFYLVGCWLVLVLFPQDVASAAILILAFGDGFASLVGTFLGATPIAYHRSKTWEGTLAGIVMATVAGGFFFPWWIALVSSVCAMLLETLPLRIKGHRFDDNLVLPLSAATAIVLLSPLFPPFS